jgi:hypothetical protein
MSRLGFPVIGVTDVPRAVAFRTAALDLGASEEWASETWRSLEHADGAGRALTVMRSESPVEPHPRLHLVLLTDTAEEQQAEVRRLFGLGARAVDWDLHPSDPAHAPGGGDRPAP